MCGGKLAVKLVKLREDAGLLVCTAPRQVLEESNKVYTMCCLWCVPVKFAKIRHCDFSRLGPLSPTSELPSITFLPLLSDFGHDCVWDLLKEVELGGTLSFTWAGDTLNMWLKVTSMYLCDEIMASRPDLGMPPWYFSCQFPWHLDTKVQGQIYVKILIKYYEGFFLDFVIFVAFVRFFIFLISCSFFCHSK